MIACYDLSCCPPTYDVVAFLAHIELERLFRGADEIELHVLPGPDGGFRRDGLWPRTVEERVALRERVLVPLCRMLPSISRVSVDRDRGRTVIGRGERWISLPEIMAVLRRGSRPLRAPAPLPKRLGLVTFTLREAAHHSLRNSRTEEWAEAVRVLGQWFDVVVVRDTLKARELIPGIPTDPRASEEVHLRAQLYSQAALNVGICNGPMWMSIFMDAPTLMLRPVTDAAGGCYDSAFYAAHGLPRGAQLPTSPSHQRLVWEDDARGNIVRAVTEMMENLLHE